MSGSSLIKGRLAAALRSLREGADVTSRAMVRIQFEAPWNSRACSER